jgi:hypothetical protein
LDQGRSCQIVTFHADNCGTLIFTLRIVVEPILEMRTFKILISAPRIYEAPIWWGPTFVVAILKMQN